MQLNHTRTFLCQNGIMHWGDRIEVLSYEAHDVVQGAIVFGQAYVGNVLITGVTGNPYLNNFPNHRGFQFYDTYVQTILTQIHYRNYAPAIPTPQYPDEDNVMLTGLTFSDQFKPQGISATRAMSFTNCDLNLTLGHRIQDSGSSRFFNFIDWDGTMVHEPGSAFVVSSHIDWWWLSPACVKKWLVWVCPKTPGVEIGNIGLDIPTLVNNIVTYDVTSTAAAGIDIGDVYQWGFSGDLNRSTVITKNWGVTGVTGNTGWYLNLYAGSPVSFAIYPGVIPLGTFIPFAISYPVGTTFKITTNSSWSSANWSPPWQRVVTRVNSTAEVMAGDGNQYYFDNTGGWLYLKLVDAQMWQSGQTASFTRDGVTIYNVDSGYSYQIVASCTPVSATQPFCVGTPAGTPNVPPLATF